MVFVVEEISGGFEVVGAGDIDGEAAFEEGEEFFFNDGGELAGAVDFVFMAPGKEALLDEGKFVPLHVLEGKLVANGEDFSVDVKAVGAAFVFNNKIVAEAEDFLAHLVSHGSNIAEPGEAGPLQKGATFVIQLFMSGDDDGWTTLEIGLAFFNTWRNGLSF